MTDPLTQITVKERVDIYLTNQFWRRNLYDEFSLQEFLNNPENRIWGEQALRLKLGAENEKSTEKL